MPKLNGLTCFLAAAAAGTSMADIARGQTICNRNVGPDVIVGGLSRGSNNYSAGAATTNWSAVVNGEPMCAFSVGTTSCNVGNVQLNWLTASNTGNPTENRHPVIGQNIYRLKTVDGAARFEQLGQAWLKHGFTALAQNHCCSNCQSPGTGKYLGVSCSDPYTASRNAGQSSLGPKWQVNAHSGVFTYPPANPPGGTATTVARRLQVRAADLDLTSSFFVEGQYVASDDAASGNQNNNASYRPIHFTGGPTSFTMWLDGDTIRERQAIRAWKLADPTVTETEFNVPNEGLFIVSSKATDIGSGRWHYEYAVYNMNSDLSAGTFSVPLPDSASVTNIGFHDVPYTDGDGLGNVNISGSDWTAVRSNNMITWSTETFAANANGNAIRWGTLYNFRFDADVPPNPAGQAVLGMWKEPANHNIAAQVPQSSPPCYANCDGSTTQPSLNVNDFICFQNRFAANDTYANCDGSTIVPVLNVNDFVCFQTAYAAGCP